MSQESSVAHMEMVARIVGIVFGLLILCTIIFYSFLLHKTRKASLWYHPQHAHIVILAIVEITTLIFVFYDCLCASLHQYENMYPALYAQISVQCIVQLKRGCIFLHLVMAISRSGAIFSPIHFKVWFTVRKSLCVAFSALTISITVNLIITYLTGLFTIERRIFDPRTFQWRSPRITADSMFIFTTNSKSLFPTNSSFTFPTNSTSTFPTSFISSAAMRSMATVYVVSFVVIGIPIMSFVLYLAASARIIWNARKAKSTLRKNGGSSLRQKAQRSLLIIGVSLFVCHIGESAWMRLFTTGAYAYIGQYAVRIMSISIHPMLLMITSVDIRNAIFSSRLSRETIALKPLEQTKPTLQESRSLNEANSLFKNKQICAQPQNHPTPIWSTDTRSSTGKESTDIQLTDIQPETAQCNDIQSNTKSVTATRF